MMYGSLDANGHSYEFQYPKSETIGNKIHQQVPITNHHHHQQQEQQQQQQQQ